MPKIELTTEIFSSIKICFDLSRSIDLHKISTSKTNENAIDGRTSGLIEMNEFVTWEAKHLGVKQRLTSKIIAYERPKFFIDIQVTGAFKSFIHKHSFKINSNAVVMKDYFEFESPFGLFGKMFNKLFLTRYMKNLLIERNSVIKDYAESGQWKILLNENNY